jgi:hypothetical protein
MKLCEYCGTKTADDTIKCDSCGATEFGNICINCSTTFSGTKCPNCGVDVGEKPRTCHRCGKKTFSVVCPKCGADLLHKEQPVQSQHMTHNVTTINVNKRTQYSHQKTKRRKRPTAFITLFAIFIILMVLVLKDKEKIGNQSNITNQNNITDQNNIVDKKNITDSNLLTLADHPKFFGDFDKADKFYDGYRKVNISTPAIATNDAKSLLAMAEYDNSNKITYISINFSKAEDIRKGLTIDDVLKVACEYVPFEILNKNYSFKEALYLTREDKDGEVYYYAMRLNDVKEERNGYLNDKLFIIEIFHSSDDNWFVCMEEHHDNWELNKLKRNYSIVEKWEMDIKTYQ